MVHFGISSDFENMKKLHDILLPFFDGQFIQTNPLPIKTALFWSHFLQQPIFRLPLCPMNELEKAHWYKIYQDTLQKIE
jgi:4-hydroxy-tetrahydrodipicolinate synthase